jgi:hypothetical protein
MLQPWKLRTAVGRGAQTGSAADKFQMHMQPYLQYELFVLSPTGTAAHPKLAGHMQLATQCLFCPYRYSERENDRLTLSFAKAEIER